MLCTTLLVILSLLNIIILTSYRNVNVGVLCTTYNLIYKRLVFAWVNYKMAGINFLKLFKCFMLFNLLNIILVINNNKNLEISEINFGFTKISYFKIYKFNF